MEFFLSQLQGFGGAFSALVTDPITYPYNLGFLGHCLWRIAGTDGDLGSYDPHRLFR